MSRVEDLPEAPLDWGKPWAQKAATREALLRDVGHILEAWQAALDELDAVGFPSSSSGAASIGGGGASEDTPVERAVLQAAGSRAAAFLAELAQVVTDLVRMDRHPSGASWTPENAREALLEAIQELLDELPEGRRWPPGPLELVLRVERLAITGDHWWPRKPPTRVGRVNQVEVCGLCGEPIGGGSADPAKRIDGQPFHVKAQRGPAGVWVSCYHTVWRQRQGGKPS